MKNRTIRNIAILGSIAIAGVISVQVYWISQALNLQQKQFQESVFISLKRVAERISDYNKMDFSELEILLNELKTCLLYTSPSPRDS
mgnify:CR=1 FL=1